ncbi:MAG: YgiW/YdeI family stress tolerance OB fold protein [Deltaproteobacteria bacterium]|nr:YgiW/YdeI family stress tolerance OB fold protein [Deltaproteobacteria bacterium]
MRTSLLPCAFSLAVFLPLALSGVTPAQAQGGFQSAPPAASGGFSGPGADRNTVQQVSSMHDDSRVVLRGNIIEHLGDDDYLFQDDTGKIRVDIDNEKWAGQNVTPQDSVELRGELDRDDGGMKIEVHRVTVVK